jgi:2'-5' RNA ligase
MRRSRIFIAVDLGQEIRDQCIALQKKLARAGAEMKWVEPENIHVTLLFLGEVNQREIPQICRVASKVCAGQPAFNLSVEGVGCFPNPRRPRIVWAGVEQGKQELRTLHDALETPLLELGCYRREDLQYTPHITLGRVRGEHSDDRLAELLGKETGWQAGEVKVEEIQVMSSQLTPQGPIYTVLGRAELGSRE